MGLFSSTKKDVFGLDIGAKTIKVLQLKKKGKLIYLFAYNSIPTPLNSIEKGKIKDKQTIASAIQKVCAQSKIHPIKTKKVISLLPETLVFTKIIEVPQGMPEEEITEALKWEIDESIPFSLEEIYMDWHILKTPATFKTPQSKILMLAAQKEVVNDYVETFYKADLGPLALEIQPSAVTRALVKKGSQKGVLIADIGALTTGITIYDQGSIQLTCSVLHGGEDFTEAIAKMLKIDPLKAEEIKLNPSNPKLIVAQLLKAISPFLEIISKEMRRSVKYYQDHSGSKIEKILLCGGGANLSGLITYFSNQTKIETEIGNPWINITTYPLKAVPKIQAPTYASVIGSALRELIE